MSYLFKILSYNHNYDLNSQKTNVVQITIFYFGSCFCKPAPQKLDSNKERSSKGLLSKITVYRRHGFKGVFQDSTVSNTIQKPFLTVTRPKDVVWYGSFHKLCLNFFNTYSPSLQFLCSTSRFSDHLPTLSANIICESFLGYSIEWESSGTSWETRTKQNSSPAGPQSRSGAKILGQTPLSQDKITT